MQAIFEVSALDFDSDMLNRNMIFENDSCLSALSAL